MCNTLSSFLFLISPRGLFRCRTKEVCPARSRSVKRTRDDENCRVQHAREKYLRVWLADPTLRYEGIHFVLGICASPTSRSFKSCLFFLQKKSKKDNH